MATWFPRTARAGLALLVCVAACGTALAGHPSDPLYTLPFPPGVTCVSCGAHDDWPTHTGQYAYDFIMPEGTTVLAARAGTVDRIVDHFTDHGLTPEFYARSNSVEIRHADGSIAHYDHLAHRGALVKVGERVREGQPIARSGNTGFTQEPHLHFVVWRDGSRQPSRTVPIRFRSGGPRPYTVYRGAKYTAPPLADGSKPPGTLPPSPPGPPLSRADAAGLAGLRAKLAAIADAEPDPVRAAARLKAYLTANRARLHHEWTGLMQRGVEGNLAAIMQDMDLATHPSIARALTAPGATAIADEITVIWWGIFKLD